MTPLDDKLVFCKYSHTGGICGLHVTHTNGTTVELDYENRFNSFSFYNFFDINDFSVQFPVLNNEFYFSTNDRIHGTELWKSDGTNDGTILVKDVMSKPYIETFAHKLDSDWNINATLPDGLFFGSYNGTFYGNPSESWPTTAYKIWANNSCCSTVGFINITVVNNITEDHVHYPKFNFDK